ncbi:MAG: hypothetical protein PVH40_08780 [Gemmatimonadales bacterium]|jgi:hypothetical protein
MTKKKLHSQAIAILLTLCIAGMGAACSDDDGSGPDDDTDTHTVIRGGVAHAPGLNDPVANCTQCHGADLQGGTDEEPSCFTCHGQKWP